MLLKRSIAVLSFVLPMSAFSVQSMYCPQNHGYISIGMTEEQVIAACGQPLNKQESNKPILRKIPVQQLMYNNKGTDTAFYGVWNLPTGSGGATLEVDVVDRQVKNVVLNGSSGNAFSICNGVSIQVGDPVGKVYAACGSPSVVNNTYVEQVVQTPKKPQIWLYQPGEYQPPVSLTFANGKLQSIN
ncbi:MAG: DUF2845 domain-containing protein [Legionella sp.]|nr:MAG: DUF2845 domain-containing protein [Legionella sp.]